MNAPRIEEREHALLSPSSAYTWIACKASTAAQLDQPDDSSEFADDGTASHELAKWCLDAGTDASACKASTAAQLDQPDDSSEFADDGPASHELAKWCLDAGTDASAYMGRIIKVGEREFDVDEERADYVQMYVDGVRERIHAYELTGATVTMFVEQRLSIAHITGEKGAKGTSDCVLIAVWSDGRAEICVIDLKYGRGVEVSAVENFQGMIYAEAARNEHEDFYEFASVRIVIHQPRISEKPSEWVITPDALQTWIKTVAKPAAEQAMLYVDSVDFVPLSMGDFVPGEKQCKFCKAKAVCPALAKYVTDTMSSDFESIGDAADKGQTLPVDLLTADELGTIYPALPLIESWAKAVRGRIEYELLNGNVVPGVKLVQGRRGARAWSSVDDAEALLKSMRLKQEQMYNFKVISPTQAEKLLAKESPRRWKKAEALITQRDGAPSVAPESDKRPALVIAAPADDFEAVDPVVAQYVADLENAAFGNVADLENAAFGNVVTVDEGEDLC
ncbi:DUF2800 domain-containing protein [Paraburkholderia sartisoli]|uniref:DUF2800 domain-containing protein n=1 Tax=Paraburkholderia sartisoli TaxID=83784 RepID=A0A1H4HUP3_9BURK|nr:DUF2800 domain-containing protein [Paraburkholderia sartisoli]SEB24768.1 Protein of unknown function [Paraburkholderia sartisoli]